MNLESLVQYFAGFTQRLLSQRGSVYHCVYKTKKKQHKSTQEKKDVSRSRTNLQLKAENFTKEQGHDCSGAATIQSLARCCAVVF